MPAEQKTDFRTVDLAGKRFYNTDFSNQDLSRLKLKQSLFMQCNFDNADLSETNCEGSEFPGSTFRQTRCYRTNFRDAKLAGATFQPRDAMGMTITLECKTFTGMKVSQLWFYTWLMLATMMEPENQPVKEDIKALLIGMIGADRYIKLLAMMEAREL